MAALGDRGTVVLGVQKATSIRNTNTEICDWLGFHALDGDVFGGVYRSSWHIGLFRAVRMEGTGLVFVKDMVDGARGPGLVETDGYGRLILGHVDDANGLSKVDLGDPIGSEELDVLGTRWRR